MFRKNVLFLHKITSGRLPFFLSISNSASSKISNGNSRPGNGNFELYNGYSTLRNGNFKLSYGNSELSYGNFKLSYGNSVERGCLQVRYYSSNESTDDPELKSILQDVYKDFGVDQEDKPYSGKDGIVEELTKDDIYSEKEISGGPEALKFEPEVIYDFNEEVLLRREGLWESQKDKEKEIITYPRGKRGVFDIEELVDFLREINAQNIAVISVPDELKYVEQLVICTGRSIKHIEAIAEKLNKMYKAKKNKKDRFLKIEGKKSDWTAIDMDNITIHIMAEEVREEKDIEMLWTVGFDRDNEWENPYASLQKEGFYYVKQ